MPTAGFGTALQIGLINSTRNMGGWQIGLVNIANKVTGTQIGLINFFKSGSQVDYKDGPAYGLLNFGYYINPRVYISEMFISNYGLYTEKPLNLRVMAASRTLYSYNEVVYSTNYQLENDINWGVSYRAGLISFYKAPDLTDCYLLAFLTYPVLSVAKTYSLQFLVRVSACANCKCVWLLGWHYFLSLFFINFLLIFRNMDISLLLMPRTVFNIL